MNGVHDSQCPATHSSERDAPALPQLDNWVAEFSLTDESDVLDEFTLDEQAKIWGLMRIAWNIARQRTSWDAVRREALELSEEQVQQAIGDYAGCSADSFNYQHIAKRLNAALAALPAGRAEQERNGG